MPAFDTSFRLIIQKRKKHPSGERTTKTYLSKAPFSTTYLRRRKIAAKVKTECEEESFSLYDDSMSSQEVKKHNRKKTMLSNELDFEPMDDSSKARSAVVTMPKRSSKHEKTIKLLFVVQLENGRTVEIEAEKSEVSWTKAFRQNHRSTWSNFSLS